MRRLRVIATHSRHATHVTRTPAMTSRRLQNLLIAAFTTTLALTIAGSAMPSEADASATSEVCRCPRKDTPIMKVKNESARIVHLNLGPGRVESIAPLQEVEFKGDDEALARAVLIEGDAAPLAALVKSGELVIDGRRITAPPSIEPSQPPTGAPSVLTPQTGDDGDDAKRNTDPIPPVHTVDAAAASAGTPASTGGGPRKR